MKKTKIIIIIIILLSCIGCDQISKTIARHYLPEYGVYSFLHDTLRLQLIENTGGFLSFGANIPEKARYWIFTILVGIFLLGMLFYLILTKQLSKNQIMALSFVAGGGFGNLADRIYNSGHVIDFMNLGIGSLRTGVFNVADIAITFGVIWYLFVSVRDSKKAITRSNEMGD